MREGITQPLIKWQGATVHALRTRLHHYRQLLQELTNPAINLRHVAPIYQEKILLEIAKETVWH